MKKNTNKNQSISFSFKGMLNAIHFPCPLNRISCESGLAQLVKTMLPKG